MAIQLLPVKDCMWEEIWIYLYSEISGCFYNMEDVSHILIFYEKCNLGAICKNFQQRLLSIKKHFI